MWLVWLVCVGFLHLDAEEHSEVTTQRLPCLGRRLQLCRQPMTKAPLFPDPHILVPKEVLLRVLVTAGPRSRWARGYMPACGALVGPDWWCPLAARLRGKPQHHPRTWRLCNISELSSWSMSSSCEALLIIFSWEYPGRPPRQHSAHFLHAFHPMRLWEPPSTSKLFAVARACHPEDSKMIATKSFGRAVANQSSLVCPNSLKETWTLLPKLRTEQYKKPAKTNSDLKRLGALKARLL